jgi:hypothetical protein
VLKDQDLDFILRFKNKDLINLSMTDRRKILIILKNDVTFLKSKGLMDYSLLLAVEKVKDRKDDV